MKQQIASILIKEMNRGEFLRYVGVAFLALVGISGVISTLTRLDGSSKSNGSDYGGNTYGL